MHSKLATTCIGTKHNSGRVQMKEKKQQTTALYFYIKLMIQQSIVYVEIYTEPTARWKYERHKHTHTHVPIRCNRNAMTLSTTTNHTSTIFISDWLFLKWKNKKRIKRALSLFSHSTSAIYEAKIYVNTQHAPNSLITRIIYAVFF